MKFDLGLWANSGDQIQNRTLHRTKRERLDQPTRPDNRSTEGSPDRTVQTTRAGEGAKAKGATNSTNHKEKCSLSTAGILNSHETS